MDECPEPANPVGQKRGIFVIRRHDHTESFETSKVLGKCKRNSRTTFGVRRVGDSILLQFRNVGDTRVFDAPKLFWIFDSDQASAWALDRSSTRLHRSPSARCRDERDRGGPPRGKASSVEPSGSSVAPALNTLLIR